MKTFSAVILFLFAIWVVTICASGDGVLQTVSGTTQLGGAPVTGTALTNGFTPAASLAGGLTVPSLTITGASPGTLILSNAAGTDFNIFMGAPSNVFNSAVNFKQGTTNDDLTVSALVVSDPNKRPRGLANGGANTVVHGTSPPTETAVVEADLSLTDLTTADVSTSKHGFAPKAPGDATKFLNGANPPAWTVPAGGGVGGATTIVQTNFVLNTVYTNGSQAVIAMATASLVGATVSGQAALDLMADQAGGTTFVLTKRTAMTTTISLALSVTNQIAGILSPSATYYFTNSSVGSGNSSSIIAGTGQTITISSGTNGATGATGAAGPSGAQVYSNQTITVAGTANQITSSAGAQDLTVSRTVTLSLPDPLVAPGVITGNGSGLTNMWVVNTYVGGSSKGANMSAANQYSTMVGRDGFATSTSAYMAPCPCKGGDIVSNLVILTQLALPSTTNIVFAVQTNALGSVGVDTPLTLTFAGGGVNTASDITHTFILSADASWDMRFTPSAVVLAEAISWKVDCWHKTP